MSRVTEPGPRPTNERRTDEHGAVAVMVALLMVPLIGFAAVSIDVAAMWAERQQLQTGADAGALAVAQDCAQGSCGSPASTAQTLATANVDDGEVTAEVSGLSTSGDSGAGEVGVTASGVRTHWFAPVLGINSSTIVARAGASWAAPSGGATLPLAVSWCDFQAQTRGGPPSGTVAQIIPGMKAEAEEPEPEPATKPEESPPQETSAPQPQETPATQPEEAQPEEAQPEEAQPEEAQPEETQPEKTDAGCSGPRGEPAPAGFGWLDTDGKGCRATSSISAGASSSGADSAPTGCSSADLEALQGRPVVVPVFDDYQGTATAGQYRIYGYAAFVLTGYQLPKLGDLSSPCDGADSCLAGYFTRSVDLSDALAASDTAPQLGAAVVSLSQ